MSNFNKWLELEQQALRKILLIILLTGGGVSPRTFSLAGLQYKQTPSTKRNLYLHNGVLCFAWPIAKTNSRSSGGISHSLYSYPPQLNWLLFIYLGIIRRFTVSVMKEHKWSLGQLETSLFVYTGNSSNRGSPWEASHMNSVLGVFSQSLFDSPFKVSDLHQITQAIYYQHFQKRREMDDIMEKAANTMGNHTKDVASHYYSSNYTMATSGSQLTVEAIELCISCSKAWHCWLGLIPYDCSISTRLGSLPILQRQQNQGVAQLAVENWLLKNKEDISAPKNINDFLARLFSQVSFIFYFQI